LFVEDKKSWFTRIPQDYLQNLIDAKKIEKHVMKVDPGDFVGWDSRTFHCGQFYPDTGFQLTEERLVKNLDMLPRNHKENTQEMRDKRNYYFKKKRQTNCFPYPIRVSQPARTYGKPIPLEIHQDDISDLENEIFLTFDVSSFLPKSSRYFNL
jgi:hypothetical protein